MPLKLYNSLTRKKEIFKPQGKTVTMYHCGPTVYDYAHLGNFRAWILADLLRRYLEYKGYQVKQIMNITDVGHLTSDFDYGEDKMEKAAQREKKSPQAIARFYEKEFLKDIDQLNIKRAWKYPRATNHIKEMIDLAKKLIQKGYAYEKNGSVYFDVTKFKKYGQLSGNTLAKLKAGARIKVNPDKKNPWDFALWISDPKHLMGWPSPWNKHGYPGWHLECSVMAMKYLGQTIDIHTGGEDNKFPHHESEIAQSEGATDQKFVRFWLHIKHLVFGDKKMAKSKGTAYSLKEVKRKGYPLLALRYFFLQAHYRSKQNFTWSALAAAKKGLEHLYNQVQELGLKKGKINKNFKNKFTTKISDDFNLPQAWPVIQKLLKSNLSKEDKLATLLDFDQILGLNLGKLEKKIVLPKEIKDLISQREKARQAKNWPQADQLRKKIQKRGYEIKDTPTGPQIKSTRK